MISTKFKAWDKNLGMGEPFYARDQFNNTVGYFPEHVIFIQYIGKKDINGIEIYDGDILNSADYPFQNDGAQGYLGVVEWMEEDLCWSVSVVCVNKNLAGRACGCMVSDHDNWEVVGNIHSNPELLEVN